MNKLEWWGVLTHVLSKDNYEVITEWYMKKNITINESNKNMDTNYDLIFGPLPLISSTEISIAPNEICSSLMGSKGMLLAYEINICNDNSQCKTKENLHPT